MHEAIFLEVRVPAKDFIPLDFPLADQEHTGRYEPLVPGPDFFPTCRLSRTKATSCRGLSSKRFIRLATNSHLKQRIAL